MTQEQDIILRLFLALEGKGPGHKAEGSGHIPSCPICVLLAETKQFLPTDFLRRQELEEKIQKVLKAHAYRLVPFELLAPAIAEAVLSK